MTLTFKLHENHVDDFLLVNKMGLGTVMNRMNTIKYCKLYWLTVTFWGNINPSSKDKSKGTQEKQHVCFLRLLLFNWKVEYWLTADQQKLKKLLHVLCCVQSFFNSDIDSWVVVLFCFRDDIKFWPKSNKFAHVHASMQNMFGQVVLL